MYKKGQIKERKWLKKLWLLLCLGMFWFGILKMEALHYNWIIWQFKDCALPVHKILNLEAALQKCSYKKVFWKYAVNLRKTTHAVV